MHHQEIFSFGAAYTLADKRLQTMTVIAVVACFTFLQQCDKLPVGARVLVFLLCFSICHTIPRLHRPKTFAFFQSEGDLLISRGIVTLHICAV